MLILWYRELFKNNGVYVPPSIQAGLPVYFAVDNYDFKNYTADGKNEFDGTAQFVYQQSSAIVVSEKVLIDHNQNTSFHCDPFPVSQVCPKPKPKTEIYPQFTPKNKDIDLYKKWDCIWFLTKTLKRENSTNVIPTWADYNSLTCYQSQFTVVSNFILPRPPIRATFIQLLTALIMSEYFSSYIPWWKNNFFFRFTSIL